MKVHANNIELQVNETRVVTLEILRSYVKDWESVSSNPLKYVWRQLEGPYCLQAGLGVST